jgi:hypothetical protein
MKITLLRQACTVAFAAAALSLSTPTVSFAQSNGKGQQSVQTDGKGKSNNPGKGKGNNPGKGTAPVPEPATWISMGTLALLAAAFARRQMKLKREANTAKHA